MFSIELSEKKKFAQRQRVLPVDLKIRKRAV